MEHEAGHSKKKHDLRRSEPAKLGASDRFVPGFFELRSKNIGQEQRGGGSESALVGARTVSILSR